MSATTILAIDTATPACSCALLAAGEVTERYAVAPARHNTLIFEMYRELFAERAVGFEDLEAVVFGCGPGSFMGVRIAASLAQGIAYARQLRVVPVSDLQAVAQRAIEQHDADKVCVAMDARMDEVYLACFERGATGLASALGDEVLMRPGQATLPEDFYGIGVGSGWAVTAGELHKQIGGQITRVDDSLLPHASDMLKLALPVLDSDEALPATQAQPRYMRHPVKS